MKINRLILTILMIGTFLLNTTTLLAWSQEPDNPGIQQVLSKKDQAIIEKFDNAKKWIDEQKPVINQFFANSFIKFKKQMDRIYQEIVLQIEELKSRNYTKM